MPPTVALPRTPRALDGQLAAASCEPARIVELPHRLAEVDVSVVVAAYNNRHLLTDLLDSLAPQLGTRAELIVVDDGSTDGSFEFLVEHATALRLSGRIVRLPRNRGRSVARNVGVVYARANTIAFTDSD